jgi:hypothetical protein
VKPLAIDLYCGLGGWTEGLLAEGYRVVGFDIEQHVYGEARYPAQLVVQDVTTIHGRQFAAADLIVASPPCQAYSYRAMPWKRAKALPPPDNTLFEACFRIQREACEASGRYIPLVVENVCGAQKWVGRARWHYGSFYLWGDVPALMPITRKARKVAGFRFDGSGGSFQSASVKVAGLNWSGSDKPGYKAQAFNGTAAQRLKAGGLKTVGHVNKRDGHSHTRHLTNQAESDAVKNGGDWFGSGADCSLQRRQSSKSTSRKAASAHIAKIPLELARHIARSWKPSQFSQGTGEPAA